MGMKTLAFIFISVTLCISAVSAQQPDTLTLPAAEFKKLLAEKQGVLIDVRTPEEFSKEKIAGH